MHWSATTIFWHVYPLSFLGAPFEASDAVEHRLRRLPDWFDYLIRLGANGLLLAPVFASATHGYDTLDHYRVDPRLGDGDDLDAVLSQARAAGIRVVLDGVFNHVSADHDIVRRALASGPGTEAGDWIKRSGEHPRSFEGSADLVELNVANPAVQDYVVGVMNHWLERGIDGWRLDAAYAAGADAWAPITRRVREAHPDAWILGEVIHGDYVDFVARSGVDSVTQYELWKALWSSLNDVNMHELAWSVQRHQEFCDRFRPQTFVGNHDVTRLASKLTDPRHLPLAVAALMVLPGIPSVYAGDEQGFTGDKLDAPRGDDAVRPVFPADPSGLLPYGEPVFRLHQELIAVRRQRPWLGDARVRVTTATAGVLSIELTGADGQRLALGLNASDERAVVPGTAGDLTVEPHGWAIG